VGDDETSEDFKAIAGRFTLVVKGQHEFVNSESIRKKVARWSHYIPNIILSLFYSTVCIWWSACYSILQTMCVPKVPVTGWNN
jgi:hypothetical protein